MSSSLENRQAAPLPTPSSGAPHDLQVLNDPNPPHKKSVYSRRRWVLVAIITLALISAGGGYLAGRLTQSPAQVAAKTAPPPANMLTAKVQQGPITSGLVMRGTVSAVGAFDVAAKAPEKVITEITLKPGDTVNNGSVIAELNGRPLIAITGDVSLYRDLPPGATGKDVRRFQQALGTLTRGVRVTGTVDDQTQQALRRVYKARKYPAPTIELPPEPQPPEPQPPAQAQPRENPTDSAPPAPAPARTGTPVLMAEFVSIPALPATILTAHNQLGPQPEGPLVTLATNNLTTTSVIPKHAEGTIDVGQQVTLLNERTGKTRPASVTELGEHKSEQGQTQQTAIISTTETLPLDWNGLDIRVSLTEAAAKPDALHVPTSAIITDANSVTKVIVVTDTERREVPVTLGATGAGRTQITPVGGSLVAGDDVLVGKS